MLLSQALTSAAAVGIGCGAGCGSSASAFLTTYVLSEGKNMRYAMSQVAAFYIGKMLAVAAVCTGGALLGNTLITGNGELAGFPLRRLVSLAMIITSLWLLRSWAGERKGCKNCRRCSAESRRIPSFTVGCIRLFPLRPAHDDAGLLSSSPGSQRPAPGDSLLACILPDSCNDHADPLGCTVCQDQRPAGIAAAIFSVDFVCCLSLFRNIWSDSGLNSVKGRGGLL